MIEQLKIKELGVLTETKLLNLGKINVICGKNNSGKTTLLKAVSDSETILVGKKINEEIVESFQRRWEEDSMQWKFSLGKLSNQYSQNEIVFGRFIERIPIKKIFSELTSSINTYFPDEIELYTNEFWNLFYDEIHKMNSVYEYNRDVVVERLKQYSSNENIQHQWKQIINKIFESFFSDNFFPTNNEKIISIEPKRTVSVKTGLNRVEKVENTGRSIIARLFRLKNQRTGTHQHNFYNKLLESFKKVSGGYEFGVSVNDEIDNEINLSFKDIEKDNWVDADYSGLGLQDLLVILYFALSSDYSLVLIEEPENHLHPEMQRKLLRFLAEEAGEDKQFFITTHSNIFVNSTYVNRVFFTKFEDGKITVNDETKQAEMLHDLGYSVTDNLVSDLIILVEGVTDVPIIEEFFSKLKIDEKYNVKTWALGGDIMDRQNLTVFAESYKVMALIDRDDKDANSRKVRKNFIKNCENLNISVTQLKRYAIENYFTIRVLKEVFKGQISDEIGELDPNTKLFDQINIDVKKNNRKLAKEMSLQEIEGTDLIVFFNKVQIELQK